MTGIQLFACPENHVEVLLVIRFLSRKKFHAKQIVVLSSSMKLGPGVTLIPFVDVVLGHEMNPCSLIIIIIIIIIITGI